MSKQEYLTIPQAAKILGISRIAVYNKVKKGQIKAQKIGRSYAIPRSVVGIGTSKTLSARSKRVIDEAVRKTIQDFGEAIRMLGRE
jgi:excisionase family DNA binding protein